MNADDIDGPIVRLYKRLEHYKDELDEIEQELNKVWLPRYDSGDGSEFSTHTRVSILVEQYISLLKEKETHAN